MASADVKIEIEFDAEELYRAMTRATEEFEKLTARFGPRPVDVVDGIPIYLEDYGIDLSDSEKIGAEIEMMKKLVLAFFSPDSLYQPVYNKVAASKDKLIQSKEIARFIHKFEKADKTINMTGKPFETEYDRVLLISRIRKLLEECILPYTYPTYGAIILRPPSIESNGQLSLGYVDDYIYIGINHNFEEFQLEAINADIIQRQREEPKMAMMEFVEELLVSGSAYFDYLGVNIYNLIGSDFQSFSDDRTTRKLFYRNVINQILTEWRE